MKAFHAMNLQLHADDRPSKGSRYAPMTAWGWVGTFVLLSIPVIGTILTIVWACGGVHNVNKKAYARGMLLLWLLTVVLTVAAWFILSALGYSPETLAEQLSTTSF